MVRQREAESFGAQDIGVDIVASAQQRELAGPHNEHEDSQTEGHKRWTGPSGLCERYSHEAGYCSYDKGQGRRRVVVGN